jgi:hypothetical protein
MGTLGAGASRTHLNLDTEFLGQLLSDLRRIWGAPTMFEFHQTSSDRCIIGVDVPVDNRDVGASTSDCPRESIANASVASSNNDGLLCSAIHRQRPRYTTKYDLSLTVEGDSE